MASDLIGGKSGVSGTRDFQLKIPIGMQLHHRSQFTEIKVSAFIDRDGRLEPAPQDASKVSIQTEHANHLPFMGRPLVKMAQDFPIQMSNIQ